jgi:hypothetical protein
MSMLLLCVVLLWGAEFVRTPSERGLETVVGSIYATTGYPPGLVVSTDTDQAAL